MTDRGIGVTLLGGVLLLAVAAAGCGIPRADLSLQGAYLTPIGKFGISPTGETIKVRDLDLGAETVVLPRAVVKWGGLRAQADGFSGGWSGTGTATATIDNGSGDVISAGTDVKTSVDLTYLAAGVTYDFFPSEILDLGVGVGAGWLAYDLKFKSRVGSARVAADDSSPLVYPMIHAGSDLGIVRLSGDLAGMAYAFEGNQITFFDLDVNAALRLFEGSASGYLVGGYRSLMLEYRFDQGDSEVRADAAFQGPYLGVQITF